MDMPELGTLGPGDSAEVCVSDVCMCVVCEGRWCVRASVGRQFQGSLIDCPLNHPPDVRYVHSYTYRHRISQDPGF